MYKKSSFQKKKIKIRKKISKQKKKRLTVYKSNKHIYAQLFEHDGSSVILSLSTLDSFFKKELEGKERLTKLDQAVLLGSLLSLKIKEKGINKVVFDRSGFKFHGRVKAVANTVLNSGILC